MSKIVLFQTIQFSRQGLIAQSIAVSSFLAFLPLNYYGGYANKTAGEKARRQLHKNAASNIEQVLEAIPHKAPTIRPPTSHHENYPS